MLRFIVLSTLIALSYGLAVSFNEVKESFEQFKGDHGVVYADAREEAQRFKIFAKNFAKIKAHNARAANGQHSYRLGVNKFADLTHDEFVAKHLGLKGVGPVYAPSVHKKVPKNELPASVDWRSKGAVTGVKDQGGCGSCWAFSTVAAIEGANFLKNGKLVSLSEQNLVDCDRSQDEGCNGGLMDNAFQYVISNHGIDTEAAYPYAGYDESCRFSAKKVGATISSYANVTSGDEDALLSAVAQQPVSVAIDATPVQLYSSGIIDSDTECGSAFGQLDHGVTVVGYGTEGSKDYWIVKNSWGKSFGEKGYFRLQRGSNLCGIATAASYPIV
ncbi:procathepsin L-like [Panonychus citri]|uniref:procathepsin L-like n=1 Tax=Panonychus citri TaxID=50023 RepID=UPI00230733AE|nr:procathepsin L-like [Panonychus citri]